MHARALGARRGPQRARPRRLEAAALAAAVPGRPPDPQEGAGHACELRS
jgi:hypothetical protein